MISGAYNIPRSIVRLAEELGLDAMATGGNVDYIYKQIGVNPDGSPKLAIVSSALDAGSPDTLRERSEIAVLLNEDWTESVRIPFPTAREALVALAKTYDPAAPERPE